MLDFDTKFYYQNLYKVHLKDIKHLHIQQRNFYSNQSRKNRANKKHDKPFCSKKCVGEFGKSISVRNKNI